jgi:hypothetical protein
MLLQHISFTFPPISREVITYLLEAGKRGRFSALKRANRLCYGEISVTVTGFLSSAHRKDLQGSNSLGVVTTLSDQIPDYQIERQPLIFRGLYAV